MGPTGLLAQGPGLVTPVFHHLPLHLMEVAKSAGDPEAAGRFLFTCGDDAIPPLTILTARAPSTVNCDLLGLTL